MSLNLFPHCLHSNGRSSQWVRRCLWRVVAFPNAKGHMEHWKFLVWFWRIWYFKMGRDPNVLKQKLHWFPFSLWTEICSWSELLLTEVTKIWFFIRVTLNMIWEVAHETATKDTKLGWWHFNKMNNSWTYVATTTAKDFLRTVFCLSACFISYYTTHHLVYFVAHPWLNTQIYMENQRVY